MILDINFIKKLVQNLENPSVKDLVGSHLGDYFSIPNNNPKKAIVDAKDTGILRLEITFYRHSTRGELTKKLITNI